MLLAAKQPLVASLLDRLIDKTPDSSELSYERQQYQFKALCESVRRDLENLLNTRKRWLSWPTHLTQLTPSLVDYGTSDFMNDNLVTEFLQKKLCADLQLIILRYEPRFKNVTVSLAANEQQDRTLHINIEGLIYAEPEPEAIVFASTLEPETQYFTISNSNTN